MAGFDYAASRTAAAEMLKSAGKTGTLKYYTLGAYDYDTLQRARVEVAVGVAVVELEFTGRANAGNSSNGQQVQQRWKKFLVSPTAVDGTATPEPQPAGWTLTLGTDVWSIANVKTLRPGDTTLLYTLECSIG